MSGLRPCFWFDTQAEEAARFYVSVFKDAELGEIRLYPNVGQENHGKPAGSVMTVEFQLRGVWFTGLNAGTDFKFNEAVSFQVDCEDQAEVDYYWEKLKEGGDPAAQVCGWLKDQFGVSWQIVPKRLLELTGSPDKKKAEAAFGAMMKMQKIEIAELERAYNAA